MPILDIAGVGRISVDDSFSSLTPEQQNATVQEIASNVGRTSDGRPRITIHPGAAKTTTAPETQPMSNADYVDDIAKSAGIGLGRGVIGLAGAAGDIAGLLDTATSKAGDYLASKMGFEPSQRPPAPWWFPNSENITRALETQTGEFYKPKTRAGEYAQTVGEFMPGAVLGPGGMARNAVVFGAAPAIASEAAGGAVRGTQLEPWVRGGAALATGIAGGIATTPGNVARAVENAGGGVTRDQLAAAEQLFQEAQAAGMPISRPEAIQYVTNGATNFGNLQRVVEGQGGMREFFARRPDQVDAAAGRAFDQVTPAAPNPSAIGPAVGRAAEDTVNDVRGAINTATDPYYTAAANIRLTPQEMARVRALPGFEEARAAVRGDPQLARYVRGLPDDSVGFLNEVKKYFDAARENASAPVNQQRNMQRSAGYGSDAADVRQIAIDASRRAPGNPYEVALTAQQQARDRYLQPLLDGPLGRLADKDLTTQKAISALFPPNPLPNSADEIATAVSALSRRNQYAARNLVRAHLESVFNEATQNLQTGANEFGGSKFAAIVRGNSQQAANLEAAVRALPNGDRVWGGVDRFLTILEAQGTRQRIGSQTAFNTEVLQDLRQGKLMSEVGSTIASGGFKLPQTIKDRIERWRMGSNVDELARLFTDPNAGREFARLANTNASGQALASFARIVGLAHRGAAAGYTK